MTISLEKKLEEATVAKKRYRSLFVIAFVSLIALAAIVYYYTVLDYAVLSHVQITRKEGNEINFQYDVVVPGRIDFYYGKAILTDRKTAQKTDGFTWRWQAQGETEIAVRSRKWFLPSWDAEHFSF